MPPPTTETLNLNQLEEVFGFEGPEKLLEIWFAPGPNCLKDTAVKAEAGSPEKFGLRTVTREAWSQLLQLVHCEILNHISNQHCDAYLLSESSLFVYPHLIILKTCGTTTLLNAVPSLLELAKQKLDVDEAYRVFYSRKSFMFPEKQIYPHSDWKDEVKYLEKYIEVGASYTIGRTNGDHWYLFMTKPKPDAKPIDDDFTIEILMTGLGREAVNSIYLQEGQQGGSKSGQLVAKQLGLSDIYTDTLEDSFLFTPCGFSMNALKKDSYFTVHVTPEEHCSYASFESNVPLPKGVAPEKTLDTILSKVTKAFLPNQFTVTLFKITNSELILPNQLPNIKGYVKSDKILYDLDDYSLLYVHYIRA